GLPQRAGNRIDALAKRNRSRRRRGSSGRSRCRPFTFGRSLSENFMFGLVRFLGLLVDLGGGIRIRRGSRGGERRFNRRRGGRRWNRGQSALALLGPQVSHPLVDGFAHS